MHHLAFEKVRTYCSSYPDELLQALQKISEKDNISIYLVGGTVRDWLLGNPSQDLDFAVPGQALHCAKLLQTELGGGTLVDLSGPDDEAVRLVWKGKQLDFSSFRAGSTSIEEDLRLRDFTVNAMAVDFKDVVVQQSSWNLIDPLGGCLDLQQGLIRYCHGAFVADPVRMLRGYRLSAGLGFQITAETKEAIGEHAPLIANVAAERITYEFQRIFESPRTTETLRDMEKTGLLQQLVPELFRGKGVEQPEFHHLDVMDHCFLALEKMEEIIALPDQYFPGNGEKISTYLEKDASRRILRALKWAALLHDIGKPLTKEIRADKGGRATFYRHDEVGRRLFENFADRSKWGGQEKGMVADLIAMHMHPFHLCNVQRTQEISKRAALKLCQRADNMLTGLFLLAMSDSLASRGEKKPEKMEEELQLLFRRVSSIYNENIAPILQGPRLLTGKNLIDEFQLQPGPIFSLILGELEVARVEGEVVDRKSARAWVKDFLQKRSSLPC